MSASLVGSEMCIRDRPSATATPWQRPWRTRCQRLARGVRRPRLTGRPTRGRGWGGAGESGAGRGRGGRGTSGP
eukprot:1385278-Alexandrium_andersonii.AAC.1